jgi:glycosyltransferase involved in cell wall biosynthesis
MDFRVSVIVPVFNGQAYLEQAVESALAQPEAEEILIVEDGSSDDSPALSRNLATRDHRIRVLQHPGRGNRGTGASRNLGIQHSHLPYLAFLDADDYFLPARFAGTRALLEGEPMMDGVYEAVEGIFQDKATERRWRHYGPGRRVTRLTKAVNPEQLFEALLLGSYGHIHIDGLTVHRNVIGRSGPFNERLRLHQDTEFCLRLAAVARLIPGSQRPVAIRRFHDRSRILAAREHPDETSISDMYDQLLDWAEATLGRREQALIHQAAPLAQLRARSGQYGWPRRTWYLFSALVADRSLAGNLSYWKLHVHGLRRMRDLLYDGLDPQAGPLGLASPHNRTGP